MEIIELLLAASGLVINTILDVKFKKISIRVTVIYGLLGIVFQIVKQTVGLWMLSSLFPGLIAILLARVTGEKIGYGDGLLILAMGCYFTISELSYICMTAVCMAGVVALLFLVVLKKSKDYAIPFVPFLFWGYVLECLIC